MTNMKTLTMSCAMSAGFRFTGFISDFSSLDSQFYWNEDKNMFKIIIEMNNFNLVIEHQPIRSEHSWVIR